MKNKLGANIMSKELPAIVIIAIAFIYAGLMGILHGGISIKISLFIPISFDVVVILLIFGILIVLLLAFSAKKF